MKYKTLSEGAVMQKQFGLLLALLTVSSISYSKEFCLKQYSKSMNRWTAATSQGEAKRHNYAVSATSGNTSSASASQGKVQRQK